MTENTAQHDAIVQTLKETIARYEHANLMLRAELDGVKTKRDMWRLIATLALVKAEILNTDLEDYIALESVRQMIDAALKAVRVEA